MMRFLSRLWRGATDGIAAAAFLIGGLSLLSRLAGLVRDRALASTFGAGVQLDAYYAAFRLPDFVYNLLIVGALSAGFIPVFSSYVEEKGQKEAMRLAERLFSVIGVGLLVASAGLYLFAPWFVPWLVPGFAGDKLEQVIHLTRIMSLSPLFLGLSAVFGGILQATRRFFAFSFAPLFYNLGIIFGIYCLSPRLGIEGVAYGVVIGAALHFISQAIVAVHLGFRRVVRPNWMDEGVRRIARMMGPRTFGLAFTQLSQTIVLGLASSLSTGSIAVFNLATNVQSVPVGLFGLSFAIAAFPALSQAAAGHRKQDYQDALGSAGRKVIFFLLPTTVMFLLLRAQIVRLLFGQGAFDWDDTLRTANVLGVLAFAILPQSLIPLLTRAFYALHNTRTPVVIGIVSEIVTIVSALILRSYFGVIGLALALTVSTSLQLVWLWIALRRQEGSLGQGMFLWSAWKILVASVAMGAVAWLVRDVIGTWVPLRATWQVILQAGAASIAGALVFFGVCAALKSPELTEFVTAIKQRLWKKTKLSEGLEANTMSSNQV